LTYDYDGVQSEIHFDVDCCISDGNWQWKRQYYILYSSYTTTKATTIILHATGYSGGTNINTTLYWHNIVIITTKTTAHGRHGSTRRDRPGRYDVQVCDGVCHFGPAAVVVACPLEVSAHAGARPVRECPALAVNRCNK